VVFVALYLDVIIKRFLIGVETCSSVDCVLVRLSSSVLELEDLSREFGWSRRDIVREFLQDKRVETIIAGLAGTVSTVLYKIESDPRFKVLRPYNDLIYEAIIRAQDRGVKPIRSFVEETRPPLWRIEYREKHPDHVEEPLVWETGQKSSATEKPSVQPMVSELRQARTREAPKAKHGRCWGRIAATIILVLVVAVVLGRSYFITMFEPFFGIGTTGSTAPMARGYGGTYPIGTRISLPTTTPYTYGLFTAGSSTASISSAETNMNKLVLSDLHIYVNDTYIWFWIRTRQEPLITVDAGGREFDIVTHRPGLPENVAADLVVADKNGFTIYFDLDKLFSLTGYASTYEFIVYPVDLMVKAVIDPYSHKARFASVKHVEITIEKQGIQNSIYEVLLDSLDNNTFNILRKAVWNDQIPKDKAWILWSLVNYTMQHFTYDYSKANMTNFYIYYPETMLRLKKGVCIDYAVFYAVSLLAAGFKKAYVYTVETSSGGHAFAAAEINGTYYVLDQRLPVPELSDYYQYSEIILGAKIDPKGYVYEVKITSNGPKILFHSIDLSRIPDEYPADKIDGKLVFQTLIDLAKLLHTKASFAVEAGSNVLEYDNWLTLHLYTPAMVKEWALFVAERIAGDLTRYGTHPEYVAIRQVGPVSLAVYYK